MSLPKPYLAFGDRYPEILKQFEDLGLRCGQAGPLDARSRRLVKLGMAIATGSKGGIKSQARRALAEGFSKEEVRHAALLSLPTIGFPAMIAVFGWMEEALAE